MNAGLCIRWSPLVKKSAEKKKKTLDVLSHELIPEMKILSDTEKRNILKKYSIEENQLPLIKHTDPAVKALNAEVGNVIRIHRNGETGRYLTYKIVV
jgi:DNA-directed RNA polymerase subunit H